MNELLDVDRVVGTQPGHGDDPTKRPHPNNIGMSVTSRRVWEKNHRLRQPPSLFVPLRTFLVFEVRKSILGGADVIFWPQEIVYHGHEYVVIVLQ